MISDDNRTWYDLAHWNDGLCLQQLFSISLQFLDEYSKSEMAQRNVVIKLINSRTKDKISAGNKKNA